MRVAARLLAAACFASLALPASAAPKAASLAGDIPAHFKPALGFFDYDQRDVMIPMRDGVKLHAVLIVPKNARNAPIMLDRTPYSASSFVSRNGKGPKAADNVVTLFGELLNAGYIVAIEDVRGKYGSEGDYVMNRPVVGPLNPTKVDHTTDAYDTIGWLVKNVPETNGRVGTIGTSYDGFTTLMSLIHPHPALKAAVPINPMVDVWKGDDWFHNGAFREEMMGYVYSQTATKDSSVGWWTSGSDTYRDFLDAGSAGALGTARGMDQLPFWKRIEAHPDYDAFWQGQAVDKLLGAQVPTVPTLFVDSLWDQEDIYGAVAAYQAQRAKDPDGSKSFLVMGPWHHGQANVDGSALGPFDWNGDSSEWFRRNVLIPFLDARLKTDGQAGDIAPVTAFETGTNQWKRYDHWPLVAPTGTTKLYLQPGGKLGFQVPAGTGGDSYVSDPMKPVTYRARPNKSIYASGSTWKQWLVDDQRFAGDRTDVLTYVTDPLTAPVAIAGQPVAHLFAATTGTDSDWVVKLIDVYPDTSPDKPELAGYQLAVTMDILRGRYRDDPAHPSAIPAGQTIGYTLDLPTANHVFLPGHRIMVQVQSSWFPLYDRNPQTYVPNIFFAKPSDYRKATQTVSFGGGQASAIDLPVVAAK